MLARAIVDCVYECLQSHCIDVELHKNSVALNLAAALEECRGI